MGDPKLKKWEVLEVWLFDFVKEGTSFTVYDIAEGLGIESGEASWYIQDYLTVQGRKKSKTLYVLHRLPGTRTRNARWLAGIRVKDARQIANAFSDDVTTRINQAVVPALRRIAVLNPRAAREAESQIDMLVEGIVKVIHGSLVRIERSGEDDS